MINDSVNGKLIIASIYDEFNIISRDWESRSPRWILDALKGLNISLEYGYKTETVKIENYKFKLPCRSELVRGIFVNGKPLNLTRTIGHLLTYDQLELKNIQDKRFYTISEKRITTEIESGEAIVVYASIPLDWDETTNMYIPRVPDIQEVIENVKWYILKIILARGYKHPVYSLTTNNPLNNPHLRWEQTKRPARLAARRMTKEQRMQMAEVLSEFTSDPHTYVNDLINELYRDNRRI